MNKIFGLLLLIVNFNLLLAQDISTWGGSKHAANQMAQGIPPSIVAKSIENDYHVIMIDDQSVILGLQAKSGGVVFIYRSENDKVLFRSGNVVVSIPMGHSNENGDTRWISAVLTPDQNDISKYSIKILRKETKIYDNVTLSRIKGDSSASWDFK